MSDALTPRDLTDKVIRDQIIALASSGMGHYAIADKLNVSWRKVKKELSDKDVQYQVLKISEDALLKAKAEIRTGTAKLAKETVETLMHHIKNKNLAAVPHVLKILGFEQDEQETAAPISVVFNVEGQDKKSETVIEVK